MLPPGLQSPREVTLHYDALYHLRVESGQAVAFLYPWAGLGAFGVFGYLLVDHRKSQIRRLFRWPVFAFLLCFQGWCISTHQAKHPAAALGVGLLSAWGIIWVAAIMIVNDCQVEFRRIERRRSNAVSTAFNGKNLDNTSSQAASVSSTTSPQDERQFYWAAYPDKFTERLDWVADVFCNFRGVGWNWQISGIPSAPKVIEEQLRRGIETTQIQPAQATPEIIVSRTGVRRFSNRDALLKHTLINLAIGYMSLDIIKTLMHRDAYFWGYTDAAAPAYLPDFVRESHFMARSYRLLLSLAGLYACLGTIFKLGPLFFCTILGPRWIGVRGEPWMNPADVFGSFRNIMDRGLAGWWAGWWHQIFRFGFEAPTNKLLRILMIDKRSPMGSLISLLIAFFLSGWVHACGSYTQMGDTRPLMGPMRFFLLQAVGIAVQTYWTHHLASKGVLQKLPRWTKQLMNVCLVHAWLYFTGPLLVDDFSQGGIWLFEPIAISPLRGIGLGASDDGWWCWGNGLVSWRSGRHFWDTGIAI